MSLDATRVGVEIERCLTRATSGSKHGSRDALTSSETVSAITRRVIPSRRTDANHARVFADSNCPA